MYDIYQPSSEFTHTFNNLEECIIIINYLIDNDISFILIIYAINSSGYYSIYKILTSSQFKQLK